MTKSCFPRDFARIWNEVRLDILANLPINKDLAFTCYELPANQGYIYTLDSFKEEHPELYKRHLKEII